MGAGILPIALYKGGLYLLLGQERNNNLWSDFGGSSNKNEKPFKTAIREGYEELNGFLGNIDELEKKVDSSILLTVSYDKYTSYIFSLNYYQSLKNIIGNEN